MMFLRSQTLILFSFSMFQMCKASDNHAKEDEIYWRSLGHIELENALRQAENLNTNTAKNIIIFVGDGMSLETVTAGRIYKAQYEGRMKGEIVAGEESLLSFEKFPHVALSKTYCVDAQTTDSAASATAIFSGTKTNIYTLGFDSSIVYNDARSEATSTKVDSILTLAQRAGKDTGFVTTARVSHATPAALYAHTANRDWECESEMAEAAWITKDITWQLINSEPGRNIKIILGGGLSSFLPESLSRQEQREFNVLEDDWKCRRLDGVNMIEKFLNQSSDRSFVNSRDQLLSLDVANTSHLLGLFSWDHMSYEYQRESQSRVVEPSLTEMTETAIKMLQKNENGFFLMVEGARIDMAHHDGKATVALHELMAFDRAIDAALKMVDVKNTLIIVTADHGHTMTISGYPKRGADIRGLISEQTKVDGSDNADDNKSYSILSYANGPGFYNHFEVIEGKVSRKSYSNFDVDNFDNIQPATVPLEDETHSSADVGIFAIGPYSHLFHSVHEQTFIAYVMAFAACLGPFEQGCQKPDGKFGANVHLFS